MSTAILLDDDDDDDVYDFSIPCVSNCVIFKHRATFLGDVISALPVDQVSPLPGVLHRTVIRKLEIT